MATASSESASNTTEQSGAKTLIIQGVAGVFVTVLAPVLVACGMKFSDRLESKADPDKPQSVAVADKGDSTKTAPEIQNGPESAKPAEMSTTSGTKASLPPTVVKPGAQVVRLFNGTDLTGFYTHFAAPGQPADPAQKWQDPDHVFVVKDEMIHISGQTDGLLITEQEYDNYHLLIEYQWGGKTWPPYEGKARNSGLLLHCNGPDGEVDGLWPKSLRCCITEGCTGDFMLYHTDTAHSISLTTEAEEVQPAPEGDHRLLYLYKPGELLTTISEGRIRRFPADLHWQDLSGYRGKEDLEEPLGSWNTLECVCQGDQVTVAVNGKTVDKATHCNLMRGKIAIQSLGSEFLIRKMELRPLADQLGTPHDQVRPPSPADATTPITSIIF